MADILIKNIEMPSCCENCRFNQFYDAKHWTSWNFCMFLDKDTDNVGNNRLADCPLVALPEHELISVHKVLDYLAERAETSKEMGDDETASLFASMGGDILAIVEANNGTDN